jgi:hypothetical protein
LNSYLLAVQNPSNWREVGLVADTVVSDDRVHDQISVLSEENAAVANVNSVDVVDFYRTITQLGIELWIDGGWGVDALLSEQTRPHKDLDIAIQQKDVAALRKFLHAQSYREIKLEDARP